MRNLRKKMIWAGVLGCLALFSYMINPKPFFSFTREHRIVMGPKTEQLVSFLDNAEEQRENVKDNLLANLIPFDDISEERNISLKPVTGFNVKNTDRGNLKLNIQTQKDDFTHFSIFISQTTSGQNFFDPFEIKVEDFKEAPLNNEQSIFSYHFDRKNLVSFVNCRLDCDEIELSFYVFKSQNEKIDLVGGRGPVLIKADLFN